MPILPIAFPKRPPLPDGAQLLAADAGGTKTHLALFELRSRTPVIVKEAVYPSRQFGSLAEIIRQFHSAATLPARLSIAFAGPVQQGKAKATNLDWSVDVEELSATLGIPEVFLINDLEAAAYGLAALKKEDLVTIYASKTESEARGNAAIIAPGTGLGEGGLYWDGSALHPFATEGGHSDFAPRNDLDCELFLYLQQQFGHVSWERVITGPGIHHIYRFLLDVKEWQEPAGMREKLKDLDPAAAISLGAQEGCPVCVETLRLFAKYLAVEAANLALKLKATGGIFIGGGVTPKVWNSDLQAVFLEHFFEVGRLRPLIEAVPVRLVVNEKLAVLGAGWYGV